MNDENKNEIKENEVTNLQSIEVGKVEEEKKGSPFLIIFFFLILVGFIIALPYTEKLINKFQDEEEKNPTSDNQNNNQGNNNEENPESIFYQLPTTTEIIFKDLKLTNFKLNNENGYNISFTANTNTGSTIYLIDKKYYIEIYSAEKTLLERIKFDTTQSVENGYPLNISFEIGENTFNSGTQFILVEKDIIDYPEIDLTPIDGKLTITCTKNTSRYIYLFNETELYQVDNTENYTLLTLGETYNSLLSTKRNETASLNNITGVSSTLIETSEEFVINTIIDNKNVVKSSLINNKFYNLNTLPKTIKFEMESMRYICN